MIRPVAARHIQRADAETIARLGELGVANVHETYGRCGLLKPYLRPSYTGARQRQRDHYPGSAG